MDQTLSELQNHKIVKHRFTINKFKESGNNGSNSSKSMHENKQLSRDEEILKIFKENDFRCYDEIDELKRIFYTFFVLKSETIALNNNKNQ